MVDKPLTLVGGTDAGDDPDGPGHVPTDQTRARVSLLAEAGVTQIAIAADIGIAKNTLRRHYTRELLLADVKVQALVGQAQLRFGLGAPAVYDSAGRLLRAELPPNGPMLMFLGKTRMGQNDGGNRGAGVMLDPPRADDGVEFNTAGLTDAERTKRVVGLLDIARARGAGRVAASGRPVGAVPEQPAAKGKGEPR